MSDKQTTGSAIIGYLIEADCDKTKDLFGQFDALENLPNVEGIALHSGEEGDYFRIEYVPDENEDLDEIVRLIDTALQSVADDHGDYPDYDPYEENEEPEDDGYFGPPYYEG